MRSNTNPRLIARLKALKQAVGITTSSRTGAKKRNDLTEACWEGYEAVGTKKKDGKTVPNCVPKKAKP